jgi:NTE family protein
MTTRALVLGGGGLAGVAWELGLLVGLQEAGAAVDAADVIVGTSAGSVVGALIATGIDLQERYESQVSPTPSGELAVDFDLDALMERLGRELAGAGDAQERRARLGRIALEAASVPEEERRTVIAGRLPKQDWPERDLRVTAVDTATGERVVFDRNSGVDLVDAVAASCAVPGVWPPVTIGGRRYMDGGAGSIANADLAEGVDRVLVVAPLPGLERNPLGATLADEVTTLERAARVLVVTADEESAAAFGANVLDPATRAPSARAGVRQAADVAPTVQQLWAG